MGFGDEIMATGHARLMQRRDPRPVAIRGKDGRARWHMLWDGNPRLSPDGRGDVQWLDNWPGNRPYIVEVTRDKWTWRPWRCPRGEIYLTAAEAAFGARFAGRLIVEPNISPKASPNKDWGFHRWQQLVRENLRLPWGQVGPVGTRWLVGVMRIVTPDFRYAAAVLANSRGYVGPEGGLHHAAAAVGIPAAVIFGGFISPANTGYRWHANFAAEGPPCGNRQPCAHCRAAMAAITPAMVAAAIAAMPTAHEAVPV